MKFFNSSTSSLWNSKVNFVDENNVLVGYDYEDQCCEDFGWFLSHKINDSCRTIDEQIATDDNLVNTLLEGWEFDPTFFEQKSPDEGSYDEQNIAIFRMTKGEHVMFLHLYNVHNGYYSHGFDFSKDGEIIHTGCL